MSQVEGSGWQGTKVGIPGMFTEQQGVCVAGKQRARRRRATEEEAVKWGRGRSCEACGMESFSFS